MSKKAEGFSLRFVLINTGNISRKVLPKVLRSFDKNFERLHQFQQMMNLIIGRALEVNNEKLSQDISCLVKQRLAGELELLLQESGQKEEERFRLLDETIRSFQKAGQEEAAATKVPFFKRKRFGRGAKKLFHREKRS